MNIKNLKMVGFKSFCNQTEVSFHRGLNAIVGPNGCGKSNISDALKWIMGEHNIRNLRGDRLEDIIFAGSRENQPLGMAEVTMIIENNGGGFPPQYAEMAEMEVTRRVFRSGESEYFINKKPCLLKDLREIFMDTGMNPRAYSILEQGSIMEIVNSSPQDLRKMLEEAAGITKYRERKAATLRKIEATRENLDRVRDIILEVSRQVKATQRQANEAKRFTIFQRELAKIDAALYHRQHEELRGRWEAEHARHASLADEVDRVHNLLAVGEAALEEGRVDLLTLEKELTEAQEGFYRASGRLEVAQTQTGHLRERMGELKVSLERAGLELAAVTAKGKADIVSLASLAAALEETVALLASLEPSLDELRRREAAFDSRLGERRRESDRVRQELNRSAQEKRTVLAGISSTEARLGGDERLLADYAGESQRLAAVEEALTGDRRVRSTQLAEKERLLAAAAAALAEITADETAADDGLTRETTRVHEGVRRLTELEGRLDHLRKVQQEGEDLRESARRLYRMASQDAKGNYVGVLGHLLQVDETHRKAVEAVLGDRLEAVLVRGKEIARSLAGRLREEKIGGATVVSWDAWPTTGNGEQETPSGTLGPAWSFIRVEDPQLAGLVRALLRDVWLVSDLESALRLVAKAPARGTFCTLDGDVVHAWGGVTVGGEPSARSVLGVAEELKRLGTEATATREALTTAESRAAELSKELTALRTRRNELEGERFGLEREVGGMAGEREKLAREITQTAERRQSLDAEIRQRSQGREKDLADLDANRRALDSLSQDEKELAASMERLELELVGADGERQELKGKIAELDVSRATALEKRRSQEEGLSRLRGEAGETALKAAALSAAQADLEERIRETGVAITRQQELMEELRALSATSGEELSRLQTRHRELTTEAARRHDELKLMRTRWETVSGELSAVSVSMAEHKTRMEETAARTLAETGFSFTPEQLAELGAYLSQPEEEVRSRSHRLRTRMAKIGPVNLAALDEITSLTDRHTFLTTQKEDLEKAVESLQEAIRKINKTSREKFAETYEAVAEKFGETFRTLFNGGEARLQIDETPDVLEAGLHIYAQPPGKKMAKLNLLSGGEKAMTAIALVFALFFVRPAPFCLMDEVDAPLDEANVERFVKLIQTTINGSQIVLITHNKRTMEMADNLVGVTMESPGVSKLVSVRLDGRSN